MKPTTSQDPNSNASADSNMLTPSKIESLKKDFREAEAYLMERFARKQEQTGKDPLVSIRTKDGTRFYVRGEAEAKKLSELLGKD